MSERSIWTREYIVEVAILVDRDEVDTPEKEKNWKRKVEKMIEDIDPEFGIFHAENWQ